MASAQDQTWLRDRKFTEGIGYRVGDFEIHPGAAAEFGYDSNFYRRAPEEGPIGALRFRITPSLSLATLGKQRREAAPSNTQPDFEFRATLSATYNEFIPVNGGLATPDPNGVSDGGAADRDRMKNDRNVGGDLDIRLAIMPGRTWSGTVSAGVARSLTPSNQGLNGDAGFRRILPRGGVEVAYTPGGGLLDWRLGYQFSGTFFEASNFTQLSNIQNQIETRGRWRFLPRTALLYDARFGFVTYLNPAQVDGKTSSHPMRVQIGVNGLVTSSFSVLAMVGWGASFYTPVVDSTTGLPQEQFNSVIGQAEVKWFLGSSPSAGSGGSSLAVGFSRDFFDSYIGTYFERDRGYADLSYFFGGTFLLVADAGAGPIVYPTIPKLNLKAFTDIRIDGSLFGEYRFKDSFGINASVRYGQNLSGTEIKTVTADDMGNQVVSSDFLKWQEFEAYLGFRWFM